MRMAHLQQLSKENPKFQGNGLPHIHSIVIFFTENQSRNTKEVCDSDPSIYDSSLVFRCGKKFKAQIQTNVLHS
jgi:hypothetical protein